MRIRKRRLKYYVNRLKRDQPVTLARYGDGEWQTILGNQYENRKNSNGCTFTPHLSKLLKRTLQYPHDYDYGMLNIAKTHHGGEIENYLDQNQTNIEWVVGDVIQTANLSGHLFPLIEQIRKKRVLVVGPHYLKKIILLGFFEPIAHVRPPAQNAILQRDSILSEVSWHILKDDVNLILWSCGLASKVFIHDIYNFSHGVTNQIDCGSMWDGYCGVKSRSYIRRGKVKWGALIKVNTGFRKKVRGETFRR